MIRQCESPAKPQDEQDRDEEESLFDHRCFNGSSHGQTNGDQEAGPRPSLRRLSFNQVKHLVEGLTQFVGMFASGLGHFRSPPA